MTIRPTITVMMILALSACQRLPVPEAPTPAMIATEADDLSKAQLAQDPIKYQKVGYEIVERECGNFFDSLDRTEDRLNFTRQELTLGGTAAAGILAALKAGISPITIAGIAFPLAASSIDNSKNTLLITPYPDETYGLIKAALKAFRDGASTPTDIYDAVGQVQNYAALCTYSGIHQLAKQALATATANPQSPPPPPAPAPAPAPGIRATATQPRALIPNIIINSGNQR